MKKRGRNEKCYCGSNKKYKKCCMVNVTKKQIGILRKIHNIKEGDDFFARFLFGSTDIRACIYKDKDRLSYDKSFNLFYQNILEMKIVKEKLMGLIELHNKNIELGLDGKYHSNQIDIENPIDDELNILFKDFFIRGAMTIEGLSGHSKFIGFDIKFLFSDNEKKFKKGLKGFPLENDDERFKTLIEFIKQHKKGWYVNFLEIRKNIEHHGWSLPNPCVDYFLDEKGKVKIRLVKIQGKTLNEIIDIYWLNMTYFCEEILTFLLNLKLDKDLFVVYIPENKRNINQPVRYIVSHKSFPGVKISC